jgi:hypothetical protein
MYTDTVLLLQYNKHCEQPLNTRGYEEFSHAALKGTRNNDPNLIIWGKKDGTSDGISSIEVSYEEKASTILYIHIYAIYYQILH